MSKIFINLTKPITSLFSKIYNLFKSFRTNEIDCLNTIHFNFVALIKKFNTSNHFYTIHSFAFHLSHSLKNTYFSHRTFVKTIIHIVSKILYTFENFFAIKIINTNTPLSEWNFFTKQLVLTFYNVDEYFTKIIPLTKVDLVFIDTQRKSFTKYHTYYGNFFKTQLLLKKSDFGSISLNDLKKPYKYYNFVNKQNPTNFSKEIFLKNFNTADNRLNTLMGFIYFYKFIFERPTLFLNFTHMYNIYNNILPRSFFWSFSTKKQVSSLINVFMLHNLIAVFNCINITAAYKILDADSDFFRTNLTNGQEFTSYGSGSSDDISLLNILKDSRVLKNFKVFKNYSNFQSNSQVIHYYSNYLNSVGVLNIKNKLNFTTSADFLNEYPVKINNSFRVFLNTYWPTRIKPNNFYKFNDLVNNNDSINMFLRKNKIFNKSRYSRNRQLYRTGVYLCLFINAIFVYFYIFSFYRFSFVFGYFWLGIGLLIISMTLGRAMKYRFYNPLNLYSELIEFNSWCGHLFYDLWGAGSKYFFDQKEALFAKIKIMYYFDEYFPYRKRSKYSDEILQKHAIQLENIFNKYYSWLPLIYLTLRLPSGRIKLWLSIINKVRVLKSHKDKFVRILTISFKSLSKFGKGFMKKWSRVVKLKDIIKQYFLSFKK